MTAAKTILAGIAAAILVAAPAAAHRVSDHGGSLDTGGLSEKQVRSFETKVLGPEHAAEHARMRQAIRAGRVSAAATGPSAAALPAPNPATDGKWTEHFSIPVIGINAVMLPTGRVLWFAYPKNPNGSFGDRNAPNEAQAWLWDPARGTGSNAFKRVDPPLLNGRPANIWCAGQALLPDGSVVVAGGNLAYPTSTNTSFLGLNTIFTFNPWSEKWAKQPDMDNGRWYPSQVLLPDGRMVIVGGLDENGKSKYSPNLAIDIFTPSADLDGGDGKLEKLGMRSPLSPRDPDLPPDGGLYPHLFWMKSGRVFVAGPDKTDSWFLHDPLTDWHETLAGHWDDVADPNLRRLWGSAVLLPGTPASPATKVEQIGGSNPIQTATSVDPGNPPNTNTTEFYDESAATPWQSGASMQVRRSHLNTVLLPDSSMVSVGGGLGTTSTANQWAVSATGSERQVDIFNPVTNTWRLGAAQAEARAYHSTALLMPDGRLVSAGDDYNGAGGPGTGLDNDTAETYEPPYLFDSNGSHAARPTISSLPDWVAWGTTFHVDTPATNVTRAALVAPGATTHANDMSQRVVPVAVAREAGGVKITAPLNSDVALPGYYMLFLIDDKGVPSAARWISLSSTAVPRRTPPVWPAATTPPVPGKAILPGKSGDSKGPSISFSRSGFSARRGKLSGRVSDASGVRSLSVALARRGKRCRWWSRRRGRLARLGSCKRPVWIRAKLKRKGGKVLWSVSLRGRVRRGHYVVALRAVDGHGNVTTRTGAKAVKVTVR